MENTLVDEETIEPFMENIYKKLDWMSREDLIKRFVSVEFNRFLEYYKDAQDINISDDKPREKKRRGSQAGDEHMSRMFINLGAIDRLKPTALIGMINDATGKRDIEIGRIDIKKKFSFFDADSKCTDLIIKSFKGLKTDKGFKIAVEVSRPEGGGDFGVQGGDKPKYKKFDKPRQKSKKGIKRKR